VESVRDAQFVSFLANRHKLPFHFDKVDVNRYRRDQKLSGEEAARELRYRFFAEVGETNGYQKIALGHQADDNAELVLMNMLRGSGPLGISGIRPVREGKFVRPLVRTTRAEIMRFLNDNGIEYVSDTTNSDMRYLRNRIRHQLIPNLKSTYNAKIVETLNRLSYILRSEEDWMDSLVEAASSHLITGSDNQGLQLNIQQFNALHTAAKRRIIRLVVQEAKGDLRRITFSHVEWIRRLCEKGPLFGRLDLPDRIRVQREGNLLNVSKESKPLRQPSAGSRKGLFQYRMDKPETVWINEMCGWFKLSEISVDALPHNRDAGQMVAFFDMDRIIFPLIIRNILPGDRFRPLGMQGRQKVQDFFINAKVPRYERAKCPVLVSNEKIIWVVGYRIDDSVKVTQNTRKIVRAELLLA
jgi:tRNA(Ile)-lysidine synthase